MKMLVLRLGEAVVGIAVLMFAVAWLSGWFVPKVAPGTVALAATPLPAGAKPVVVEAVMTPVSEWASGSLAAARRTVVSARILARIEEIRVRAGDEVKKGDLLVRLDARDLEARLGQVRDALKAARARLDLARTEARRARNLFARGVITQQRLDQAETELNTAEAEVRRLEEAEREAATAVSYATIRAPVSGRVIDRLAEPGETVSPGEPLLTIYDPTTLRAEVPVRESLAVRLAKGQHLVVEVPALGSRFDGPIEEIVPFAEPGARTLLVKVGLPDDPRLYAGLFARVEVPAGKRRRLLVPAAAIERIGQLEFVDVLADAHRVERRLITTGQAVAERVEVLSGLAEGERVLMAGGRPGTAGNGRANATSR